MAKRPKRKQMKVRKKDYDYFNTLKENSKEVSSLINAVSKVVDEHKKQLASPYEKMRSKLKEAQKVAEGTDQRRTMTAAKLILRMVCEGNNGVVDDVMEFLDDYENDGSSDPGIQKARERMKMIE